MTQPAPPRRRRLWRYLAILLGAGVVAAGGLGWYLTTDSFQDFVRRRLVSELERTTGGRVEIGSFHTSPLRLRLEVNDVTIHGREPVNELPLVHVDRLVAEAKIISVLGAELGFHSLILEHPVIHLISGSNGISNVPEPKLADISRNNVLQKLFALSVSRLEVRRGELVWNDQRTPLDFVAQNVSAEMDYSLLRRHYQGSVLIGKADARFKDYRPLAWMAEAHFILGSNAVQIQSMKFVSGHSRVEASGGLDDFNSPKIHLDYNVAVSLPEAAAISHQPGIRSGMLETQGTGTWTASAFFTNGKITLSDFDGETNGVKLHHASVSSNFNISRTKLTLLQLQGNLFGGAVSGDAEVTDWLSWPVPEERSRKDKSPQQKGIAHFRLKDVAAGEAAAILPGRARLLSRLHPSGMVAGTIEARWSGAPFDADAALSLDVVPPKQSRPGQLPLNAHLRGTYHAASDELELAQLDAATPDSEIHAAGRLAADSALKFSMTTTNLAEWQPILAAFGYQAIPVILHGRASFSGNASGRISDVSLAGSLQAQDFEVRAPATHRTPAREIHIDSAAAQLELSRHNVAIRNAVVHHGTSTLFLTASAILQNGDLSDRSPFVLHVELNSSSAEQLGNLLGYSYPVEGTVHFYLRASGTKADPHGEGQIELSNGTLYGEPFQRLQSDLRFIHGEAEFNNIQFVSSKAHVNGGGTYIPHTHAIRFNLNGANFDLARISQQRIGRINVGGSVDFAVQGAGTLEKPVIQANIHLHDLTVNQEKAGDLIFDAVTHGPNLHLTGQSQFHGAELTLAGDVRLREDWPATLKLKFAHLDADPLLKAYLPVNLTGQSAVDGVLDVQGPLLHPDELKVFGDLSSVALNVEKLALHNGGPVRFSISGQALSFGDFQMIGERTDFSAGGSVQLNGNHDLQLHAKGKANLRLIETFNRDFTSSGIVTVDVTASGTTAQPVVQGKVEISHGSIAYIDLPSALSDINGTLAFNQRQLQIESLTAHTGGGVVTFTGFASLYNRQLHFDLGVLGQEVRLRYPPGVSSTANMDLHFAGTPTSSLLSGDITVSRLTITPGFDFANYLARSAQTNTLPQTNPLLNRIRMDVHVVTTPELQMQTAAVRLSGDADLRLRGTAARPALLGRADILEGEIYFNGTKYRLDRGDVIFVSPVSIEPILDLQATTQIRDYDITLDVTGQPDRLNITYRSEPPLAPADIVALLALGRTREEAAQQQGQSLFSQEASNAILAEALNAAVNNRVQRLFGGSRIKIDPEGLSTETTLARGPAITIEQQVAGNLTLTYTTNVSQTSQQVIQAEYNISHNVSIVAIRDQNGVVSFDVKIRHRKK